MPPRTAIVVLFASFVACGRETTPVCIPTPRNAGTSPARNPIRMIPGAVPRVSHVLTARDRPQIC